MKVVLFCGGLGTRLREHSETIPKPLVNIGHRPILWHLMRYYAHFGHKDFILCLGHGGDLIREFFLNYNECLSNDFVLSIAAPSFSSVDTNHDGQISRSEWDTYFNKSGSGASGSSSSGTAGVGSSSTTIRPPGVKIELLATDVQDWRITFVDTGLHSNIGQRLLRVRRFLAGESAFLANYSDGLSDLPLDRHIADFEHRRVTASIVAVPPPGSFHSVQSDSGGLVTEFGPIRSAGLLINGGFFCLRSDIFEYMQDGDELVEAPFQRLSARRQLAVFRYDGFWQAMDTFKDKMAFDSMHARGECPWMLWKQNGLEEQRPAPRLSAAAEQGQELRRVVPGSGRKSAAENSRAAAEDAQSRGQRKDFRQGSEQR